MTRSRHAALVVLVLLLTPLCLLTAGCEFEDDLPELGTPGNPVVITFIKSTKEASQLSNATDLVEGVARRTGLTIVSQQLENAALIEGFATGDVQLAIGVGPMAYAESYERGGRIKLAAVRYGLKHYQAMIVAHADSGIETVKDCENKTFAFSSVTSTSGYVFPKKAFEAAGVTLAEERKVGSHDNTISEVYRKSLDVGASYWSPPRVLKPEGIDMLGYRADIETGNVKLTNGMTITWDGRLLDASGAPVADAVVEVNDARSNQLNAFPDILKKVKIVALTPPIPNDGVVFHANLPSRLTTKLVNALKAFSRTEEGEAVLEKMYRINSLADTNDDEYASFRAQVKGH